MPEFASVRCCSSRRQRLPWLLFSIGLELAIGEWPAQAQPSAGDVAASELSAAVRESVASSAEPPVRGIVKLESPRSAMVRIPASSFSMGSEESDLLEALADCAREPYGHRCTPTLFVNEMPRHLVHLSSFWIDRFEVRVCDYERCVQAGVCGVRPSSEGTLRFDLPDYPVSRVTWNDAQTYCAFRGARLLTEAEYERAARGSEGRRYPWGDLWNPWASNHGRFGWDITDASDGFAELAPVGSFGAGATPEGVYDLAGNVAEWVSDRYAPVYEAAPVQDPQGPVSSSSNLRVVRGGGYGHARFWLRGASRTFAEPNERRSTL
ncbi:MAG TPA: SUMF1/EgtB/PvdO family nonheme iron enzyme, partial [Polyangiaceae bacterium]|nr:SUMF1/EgtB/PvdO family nonheme iron enzyme [Polyangiaceae bacterium]